MTTPATDLPVSYPRQEAATRRFRLGVPRAFRIAPDGTRLAFIRSAGGRDPVGSLWVAEADGAGGLVERLVVDARELVRADADLSAAEKSRRERMRETTAGITGYSTNDEVTCAAFCLDGVPYFVDLLDASAAAVELMHPGPVVDPQLSPDGMHVAFAHDRGLYVVDVASRRPATCLCEPDQAHECWGLADFVAAEELDRYRGLWWLPTSDALLAELVDESDVEVRWICDPARPELEPVAHRYPIAGSANPVARLFLVSLSGSRTEIDWDHDAYPYLATVATGDPAGAVISVLSRDQQRQLILDLPAGRQAADVARVRTSTPWLTLHAGVPVRTTDGSLLEIVASAADDCFQLVADDRPLTPPGMNVTAVIDVSPERVVITAQTHPMEQHVLVLDRAGTLTAITRGDSVNSVVASSGGLLLAGAAAADAGTTFDARLTGGSGPVQSLAEKPVVRPVVTLSRQTARRLPSALLWPAGHVQGAARLPVVMAPYGGPHHARVTYAGAGFAADQWLADQGFAVVVVDGAGTPGCGPAREFEVHEDLARIVLDDQVAALQALGREYPDLDLGRVGITGWSFGGYLAALAVLDRPDVFHVAVAGAPVTDWRLYDTAYSERYLGLPQEHPDGYDASSLLTRADRLTRPLLLIHGLADDNVLVANTLQFSGALLAAGKAHSVLPLSGVTHMTPQEVVAENLLHLQVDFLRQHLA